MSPHNSHDLKDRDRDTPNYGDQRTNPRHSTSPSRNSHSSSEESCHSDRSSTSRYMSDRSRSSTSLSSRGSHCSRQGGERRRFNGRSSRRVNDGRSFSRSPPRRYVQRAVSRSPPRRYTQRAVSRSPPRRWAGQRSHNHNSYEHPPRDEGRPYESRQFSRNTFKQMDSTKEREAYPMGPRVDKEQWQKYLDWLETRAIRRKMMDLDISTIYKRSVSLSPGTWKTDGDKKKEDTEISVEEKRLEAAWKEKIGNILKKEADLKSKKLPISKGKEVKKHPRERSDSDKKKRASSTMNGKKSMFSSDTDSSEADQRPSKRVTSAEFISCEHFKGIKRGYIFKRDSLGVGYYLDASSKKEYCSVEKERNRKKHTEKHSSKKKRKEKSRHKQKKESSKPLKALNQAKCHHSRPKKKQSRKRSPSSSSSSQASSSSDVSSTLDLPKKQERSFSSEVEDSRSPPLSSPAASSPPLSSLPPSLPPPPREDSESSEEDLPGPQPLDITVKLSNKIVDYGGALRPGEGEAIAQYVQEGKRIPRRGEVGLTADEIESYETLGYVMSGSRHRRMNAIRIRKENQVYSAEEQRALAMYNYEERANREGTLITDLREMLKKQNETIFSETLEEQFASVGNQKNFI